LVLKVRGILYRFRGKGDGAVKVIACVSVNIDLGSADAEIVVEYDRSRGAKMVRYGFGSASSFSTKGFVGSGDTERGFTGTAFAEKGRRDDIRDDSGGGSSDVNDEGGAQDWLEEVKRELPAH
jgi:hypothetical protein